MSSVPEERDPGPTESPGITAPEVSIEAEVCRSSLDPVKTYHG